MCLWPAIGRGRRAFDIVWIYRLLNSYMPLVLGGKPGMFYTEGISTLCAVLGHLSKWYNPNFGEHLSWIKYIRIINSFIKSNNVSGLYCQITELRVCRLFGDTLPLQGNLQF